MAYLQRVVHAATPQPVHRGLRPPAELLLDTYIVTQAQGVHLERLPGDRPSNSTRRRVSTHVLTFGHPPAHMTVFRWVPRSAPRTTS